ncbi:hypothetical protein ACIHFD_36110 [Nonomuraea sp. NPDC051941]|uniref:hypothetical protein n=1 Tax=Nonomuraea sp. NPDC051941 TaxID=3364373 RepID=UPI0037C89206
MKRRWSSTILEHGLIRDSAAWFVPSPSADDSETFRRTLAAAVYLALGTSTRAELATMTGHGAYSAFFAAAEDSMPVLLFFRDKPTGHEVWHRYLWTGPPTPGPTCPYTKVARAARDVPLSGRHVQVVEADHAAVVRAERSADATRTYGSAPLHLRRLAVNDLAHGEPAETGRDKLTLLCAILAADLYAAFMAQTDMMT